MDTCISFSILLDSENVEILQKAAFDAGETMNCYIRNIIKDHINKLSEERISENSMRKG